MDMDMDGKFHIHGKPGKYFCLIAKFSEDILNHGGAIASGRFSARRF